MEYYNNKLCITHAELADGIVSRSLIDKWKSRGKVERVRRGCSGTPALFVVESLPLKYKIEVYRRFPDMKAQAESKPFVENIKSDNEALYFYATCKLSTESQLSYTKVQEYANNAAILNAFHSMIGKCGRKTEFWKKVAQALLYISKTLPNSLPKNARRLQEKYNQYQREGYSALISGKYNTRNAAKK